MATSPVYVEASHSIWACAGQISFKEGKRDGKMGNLTRSTVPPTACAPYVLTSSALPSSSSAIWIICLVSREGSESQ